MALAPATVASPTLLAAAPGNSQAVDLNTIFTDIQALVKEYYPAAKITKEDNKLHFQYRVLNLQGKHSGTIEPAPLPNGIIGDISVQPGSYDGPDKDLLPSDIIDQDYSKLTMAPFSRQRNTHLLTKLTYPSDISADFKDRFKALIHEFNATETVIVPSEEKPTPTPSLVLKKEAPDVIYKNIVAVVKQYYPQASITLKGNSLHFERKIKQEFEHYSRKLEMAPDYGGVLGDIELKPGEYNGADKDKMPAESFQGHRSTLLMAPYSKALKSHLYVKILFSADTQNSFKEQLKANINSFNAGE